MILLDGSVGEGGGQILRTAMTLSVLTRQAFKIVNIRANRPNPGLQAQHLKSVEAAAAISRAHLTGNQLRSTVIEFRPEDIQGGDFIFDIGTAGATSLVLQTIFIPLAFANTSSKITIIGGTHVPWSPCYHYLELQWLPFMERLGFRAKLKLVRAGFYPHGGGEIHVQVEPVQSVCPLNVLQRGPLKELYGISAYANLNPEVAERQKRRCLEILKENKLHPQLEIQAMRARGKNTLMLLLGKFEYSQCCYYALGARGKRAEKVAQEASDAFLRFLDTSGVSDEYLADQIILPLSLTAEPSEFRTPRITRHLLTNVEVIKKFLPVEISIAGKTEEEGVVQVKGCNVR